MLPGGGIHEWNPSKGDMPTTHAGLFDTHPSTKGWSGKFPEYKDEEDSVKRGRFINYRNMKEFGKDKDWQIITPDLHSEDVANRIADFARQHISPEHHDHNLTVYSHAGEPEVKTTWGDVVKGGFHKHLREHPEKVAARAAAIQATRTGSGFDALPSLPPSKPGFLARHWPFSLGAPMPLEILGRRFSLSPVLGVRRFAFASDEERRHMEGRSGPPSWARRGKETANSPAEYAEYLRRSARGAPQTPETIPPAPEEPKPAPAPSPAPKPQAASQGTLTPGRAKAESTVYTRALGSESPKAKAKYAQRELTPEDKDQIDAWVAEHGKKGAGHINPMAVALDVDAPVHRIAHYIESRHGVPTVPGEGVSSAEGGTSSVPEGNFEEWLQDHALRQAAADKRFRGMPEGATPVTDEEGLLKGRKEDAAERLAEYVKEGVISKGAAKAGVARQMSVGSAMILGQRFSIGGVLGRGLRGAATAGVLAAGCVGAGCSPTQTVVPSAGTAREVRPASGAGGQSRPKGGGERPKTTVSIDDGSDVEVPDGVDIVEHLQELNRVRQEMGQAPLPVEKTINHFRSLRQGASGRMSLDDSAVTISQKLLGWS